MTLEPKLHRLLVTLLDQPHLMQVELGEQVGTRGRELTALRDELQQKGLVRVHRFLRYALWEYTANLSNHKSGSRSEGRRRVGPLEDDPDLLAEAG